MRRDRGYPIPDGYRDETINLNPSVIGYEYEDMLESRDKGLRRQYPYSSRPIAMSIFVSISQFFISFALNPNKKEWLSILFFFSTFFFPNVS